MDLGERKVAESEAHTILQLPLDAFDLPKRLA
jgi:hypothetical protein